MALFLSLWGTFLHVYVCKPVMFKIQSQHMYDVLCGFGWYVHHHFHSNGTNLFINGNSQSIVGECTACAPRQTCLLHWQFGIDDSNKIWGLSLLFPLKDASDIWPRCVEVNLQQHILQWSFCVWNRERSITVLEVAIRSGFQLRWVCWLPKNIFADTVTFIRIPKPGSARFALNESHDEINPSIAGSEGRL